MGVRPLGTTIEIKPSGSFPPPHGKFFDENQVYPSNHVYLVGTSRDSIHTLIYNGTQNVGGDTIQSEAYTDISSDAFYYTDTTDGGNQWTVTNN